MMDDRTDAGAGVSRRGFITLAGAGLAGTLGPAAPTLGAPPDSRAAAAVEALGLGELPNFCGHEHWGSIGAIGTFPGGFRADAVAGALPWRTTRLTDLLLDPYLGGWLAAAGHDANRLARGRGAKDLGALVASSPSGALEALRPALDGQRLTGAYQCLRRGLEALYDVDIDSAEAGAIDRLDASIGERYSRLFAWYPEAMRTMRFSRLVRPVHPEFYYREASPAGAKAELAFTETVMRIDPLLELGARPSSRRDELARLVGVEPRDAASWRSFLARLFERADARGALGIKQLQAYRRSLEFRPRSDGEVRWSGELSAQERTVQEDWIVHECCRLAHERGWPHQFHVGTHNLRASSPLPLEGLASRYPRMKVVQIHCWPFLEEAGWLAKHRPNVYLDTCWLPVLSPVFFARALATWLAYLPSGKILCAHDSTSVEMAAGSARFTREILAQVLLEHRAALGLDDAFCRRVARDLLHDNAERVYGPRRTG